MLLYRTWIEIKKSSIKNNVKNIKAKIPGNKLFLGVVKGQWMGLWDRPVC